MTYLNPISQQAGAPLNLPPGCGPSGGIDVGFLHPSGGRDVGFLWSSQDGETHQLFILFQLLWLSAFP